MLATVIICLLVVCSSQWRLCDADEDLGYKIGWKLGYDVYNVGDTEDVIEDAIGDNPSLDYRERLSDDLEEHLDAELHIEMTKKNLGQLEHLMSMILNTVWIAMSVGIIMYGIQAMWTPILSCCCGWFLLIRRQRTPDGRDIKSYSPKVVTFVDGSKQSGIYPTDEEVKEFLKIRHFIERVFTQ